MTASTSSRPLAGSSELSLPNATNATAPVTMSAAQPASTAQRVVLRLALWGWCRDGREVELDRFLAGDRSFPRATGRRCQFIHGGRKCGLRLSDRHSSATTEEPAAPGVGDEHHSRRSLDGLYPRCSGDGRPSREPPARHSAWLSGRCASSLCATRKACFNWLQRRATAPIPNRTADPPARIPSARSSATTAPLASSGAVARPAVSSRATARAASHA